MTTDQRLADLRKTYAQRSLSEADVLPDAVAQFRAWLDEALAARLDEPTALTLSTVAAGGQPSSRVVLLKGLPDDAGFLFYTNYDSRKGHELGRPAAGGPQLFLARPGAAGARGGPRRKGPGNDEHPVFSAPPARQPARGLGIAPKPAHRRPRRAGSPRNRRGSPICRPGPAAAPPALGRLPAAPAARRVLAGPAPAACTTAWSTGSRTARGPSAAWPLRPVGNEHLSFNRLSASSSSWGGGGRVVHWAGFACRQCPGSRRMINAAC